MPKQLTMTFPLTVTLATVASPTPEAAPASAPAPREITCLWIGQTWQGPGFRVHRYRGSVQITHTEDAGKAGKTCTVLSVDCYRNENRGHDLTHDLQTCDTWTDAEDLIRHWCARHADEVSLHERTEKAIKVAPADWANVVVENPGKMRIRVEWDGFCVRDLSDPHNEPTLIPRSKGEATSVKRARAWAVKNREALASMTFSEVWHAMTEAGMRCHYYCAVD